MLSRRGIQLFGAVSARHMAMTMSTLPDFQVLNMPALSPTMETGNLVSWAVKEGQEVAPGDELAQVETDKATLAYENQDDGFIARILVEAGGEPVKVGTPLAILVEDEGDIKAVQEASVDELGLSVVGEEKKETPKKPKKESPPPKKEQDAPKKESTPPPPPPKETKKEQPKPKQESAPKSTGWGSSVYGTAIGQMVEAQVKTYADRFGPTLLGPYHAEFGKKEEKN